MNTYAHREPWLHGLVTLLRPHFAAHGATIPEKLRVSCGWPSKRALAGSNGSRFIGQCWYAMASADCSVEIFISPAVSEPVEVAAILAHELVHACLPVGTGHKAPFKQLATAIGLTGKMTATTAGPAFIAAVEPMLEALGPYPHAKLDGSNVKKQSTRLLKAECGECGYTVRVTAKWINEVGAPHCPNHGEMTLAA